MPLYAAICRSLERKLLIFLRLGFFFEPEWGVASDERVTSGSAATKGVARPSQPKTARESLSARHDLSCRIHPTFVNTPVVALARVRVTVVPA